MDPQPTPKPPSACPACDSVQVVTTSKAVTMDSYWRCCRCGEVWNVQRRKQGRSPGYRSPMR